MKKDKIVLKTVLRVLCLQNPVFDIKILQVIKKDV